MRNQGGNVGNEGRNAENMGGNSGNAGGNAGDQSGNEGNQGGNAGNQSGNEGIQLLDMYFTRILLDKISPVIFLKLRKS